jgi:aerobic-type carbon monoxide dehydrogenase small subunit (CoxS/CutS family)
VHIDGNPARACVMPVGAAVGRLVTTVEGIGATPLGQRVKIPAASGGAFKDYSNRFN